MDAFGSELNDLLVATYRSIGRIEELLLRNMSGNQLSISELHTLECIGVDRERGLTITEISQRMGITLPSVTVTVKRLEKKGYVTKTRSRDDARQVEIRLTHEGRRADVAHRSFHRKMVNAVINEIPEEDRPVVMRAVRAMNTFFRENLEQLERSQQEGGGNA